MLKWLPATENGFVQFGNSVFRLLVPLFVAIQILMFIPYHKIQETAVATGLFSAWVY
jgi:hypothetical protein